MSADSKPFDGRASALRAADRAEAGRLAHLAALGLFLACVVARCAMFFAVKDSAKWAWLDELLVLLAVVTTLIGQAQRLPLQNVLLAGGLITLIGGAVQALGAGTGIPFGALAYTDKAGPKVFGLVPWSLPLIWAVVIFNARGVARLVFRPWRKTRHYGFFIIGLSCVLAVVFDLGLDTFASKVGGYWYWPLQGPATWYRAPLINFLGWLLTALLILAFTTPFLLNKKPQKSPPFFHPLILWLAMNAVFAAGALAHQLWAALVVTVVASLVTLGFALSGARW